MFICRELDEHAEARLEAYGFRVCRLSSGLAVKTGCWTEPEAASDANETVSILVQEGPVDWIITDHYSIDWRWETALRAAASKIMVIDDLADRRHDCDLLLDQNLHNGGHMRYEGYVPAACNTLLGPEYALIGERFSSMKRVSVGKGKAANVLVSFGGSDPTNETVKALTALDMLRADKLHIDVVAGDLNSSRTEIEQICADNPHASLHVQPDDMAELMSHAGIAIGASGTTVWERCCVGLPSIIIAVAENQVRIAEALAEMGIVKYLGWHERVKAADIKKAVKDLLNDYPERMRMSRLSMKLVDGNGARRVADLMRRGRL